MSDFGIELVCSNGTFVSFKGSYVGVNSGLDSVANLIIDKSSTADIQKILFENTGSPLSRTPIQVMSSLNEFAKEKDLCDYEIKYKVNSR